ncbi:MAG: endonuclease III [Halobacteriovoraceae bacterium]|nr:endonuclease III [Halobacteriovoraceae bacterium]MCB9095193.1 endonuclease III [Halobacteriovoraceae bacterium]
MSLATSKNERAKFILGKLEEFFPETPIPLDHSDPYTLLIAVLLSAQCTDVRVNQVTPALFKRANTPQKMIKLSIKEIENIVRPCGLAPRKAKAIWNLSEIIINEHSGQVPSSLEELEKLPGVGHKTAQVVMAQAFGEPSFPVDTHIHRLAQIWGLTNGKNVSQTEKDLKKIFPVESWNKLHLQIIFYGREYCQARQCDGRSCVLCKQMFPNRKQKKEYNRA